MLAKFARIGPTNIFINQHCFFADVATTKLNRKSIFAKFSLEKRKRGVSRLDTITACSFFLLIGIFLTFLYLPLKTDEHVPFTFQATFQGLPSVLAREIFHPGTTFTTSYDPLNNATIIDVIFLDTFDNHHTTTVIATINASVGIDNDGDYTYDSFDISPGVDISFQINSSVFIGTVYRISENHTPVVRNIIFYLNQPCLFPKEGDLLRTEEGIIVGEVLLMQSYKKSGSSACPQEIFLLTAWLFLDSYANRYYLYDSPLFPEQRLVLFVNDLPLQLTIKDIQNG